MSQNDPLPAAPQIGRLAVIGTYPPRRCGIATFTSDLCKALSTEFPSLNLIVLPVNDTVGGYRYPDSVRFELFDDDPSSYRRAADFLNINRVDLVCVQHEYGIFGGLAGGHIVALLRDLRMPIVTTLHTILQRPEEHQRRVLNQIAAASDRMVVMSRRAADFLQEINGVPAERIDLIPHGIPDVPFVAPAFHQERFGIEGKFVLLTFGLLSPNKGIENVIKALPRILSRFSNVVYIVVGATHPHVRRGEGESYRLGLQRLARKLRVENSVVFHDRFVSDQELAEFIGATDIFITPYLNPAQIVSGVLSFALGAGKAIVSTPFWYAEELLADGRGLLVPFNDHEAIATRVVELLANGPEREALRQRAYQHGREMIWPRVAQRYMQTFERARADRLARPRAVLFPKTLDQRPGELPELNLSHLQRLTDGTGVLQHAVSIVPNYLEGYTTDDNARGLIVAVLLDQLGEDDAFDTTGLAARYAAFILHAFNPDNGRFRNFMSFDRRWLDDAGSEDAHGRALWALGAAAVRPRQAPIRSFATRLFDRALPAVHELRSPRAWAFAVLGLRDYLERFSGDRTAGGCVQILGDRLHGALRATASEDWPWFEDVLSYCNAVLPHALLVCGQVLGRADLTDSALATLEWLARIQESDEGHFIPIGSNSVYRRNGTPARFDQQPVETGVMVSACLEAHRVTGDAGWLNRARRAFDWYLGYNDLNMPLYDPATGGCRDGLHPDRANENEGAESTLAFLTSLLEFRLLESEMHTAPADRALPGPPPHFTGGDHESKPVSTVGEA